MPTCVVAAAPGVGAPPPFHWLGGTPRRTRRTRADSFCDGYRVPALALLPGVRRPPRRNRHSTPQVPGRWLDPERLGGRGSGEEGGEGGQGIPPKGASKLEKGRRGSRKGVGGRGTLEGTGEG